ncbi:unnamed protein product [Prorocentrum cordatum]|uniref:CobW C-terminal domain-containing protein n=1 Tax=Prorocentrum cordatum TaxID=2364126 RepID=A0ABN9VST8_9DINO|nr:unnamed protein product [Polarella glacialis]
MSADKPLRFAVGARVECNVGQWESGTVVAHWWHDPGWPQSKRVPYQIKLDHGPTIFAPLDDDRCIRTVKGLLQVGQIPVTILTGFLGAGKTTLLNYILTAQHGKKYAIIENEFGAVAIDNQLLDQAVGKRDTVESISVLDNGCLCCTVRDDLVQAIKDIVDKVEQRYADGVKDALLDGILIETTGMADPGPIINTFSKDDVVKKYCKIDGVITVVDCKHFLTQLNRERSEDSVNESAQQVGFADKLLLNKIDVCSRELIDETKQTIRDINAFVPIRECCLGTDPAAVPLGELLAIDAFDSAKLLTEQTTTAEVNLVASLEEVPQAGHDAGREEGHGEGHGDAHGSGHGGGPEDEHSGHGGGHGGGGHGGGHGHGHGRGKGRHDTDVASMVLERAGSALNMHKFQIFLGSILEQRSVDLYRYKGVLAVEQDGGPALYILQGVHDMPELTYSRGVACREAHQDAAGHHAGGHLDKDRYRKDFDGCFD